MFFHFPQHANGHVAGRPWGFIGGLLLLDSGEVDRTFLFRCQDRYLPYNSLAGMRSILLVADDRHAALYQQRIELLNDLHRRIASRTSVLADFEIPAPAFVTCDLDSLRLTSCSALEQLWGDPRARREATAGVALNQVSPTATQLLTQLRALFATQGVDLNVDLDAYQRAGELAIEFHGKDSYVQLVRDRQRDAAADVASADPSAAIAAHVPTAVIAPAELLQADDWRQLLALFRGQCPDGQPPRRLFVKSSLDSGGNVSQAIGSDDFADRMESLRREVSQHVLQHNVDFAARERELREFLADTPTAAALDWSPDRLQRYVRLQSEQRRQLPIKILLQPVIEPEADEAGLPVGVGFSYQLAGVGRATHFSTTAQVFSDAGRRHFLGAFLCEETARQVMSPSLSTGLHALCDQFASRGYRGPINFDARLNREGRYELIYDCNPRLTAIFPALAMRDALRREGLQVQTLLNIDYRGRFTVPDLDNVLSELERGGWLFSRALQRGALLMPSLARASGFDVFLINMSPMEMRQLLASSIVGSGDHVDQGEIESLYL